MKHTKKPRVIHVQSCRFANLNLFFDVIVAVAVVFAQAPLLICRLLFKSNRLIASIALA